MKNDDIVFNIDLNISNIPLSAKAKKAISDISDFCSQYKINRGRLPDSLVITKDKYDAIEQPIRKAGKIGSVNMTFDGINVFMGE